MNVNNFAQIPGRLVLTSSMVLMHTPPTTDTKSWSRLAVPRISVSTAGSTHGFTAKITTALFLITSRLSSVVLTELLF